MAAQSTMAPARPTFGSITFEEYQANVVAAAEVETAQNGPMDVWSERKRRIKREKREEKMRKHIYPC